MVKPSPGFSHPARYFLKLLIFALLTLLLAYAALDLGMAWMYVDALGKPPCNPDPDPISGIQAPQEIALGTADGLTLRAWYYPSQNGDAIIALGGPGGSLGNTLPPVEFLIRQGFGVLQVDSRACASPPAPVTIGAKEVFEAEAALEYLLRRPEVSKIGAFGFSMGGATAIRTAARRPEIAAVVAEGGYYNIGLDFIEPERPKPWWEKVYLNTIAWVFRWKHGIDPFQVSPVDDLPKISPRPVLLIYGELEIHSGRGDIQYAAAQVPKELWIVPGGRHGTNHQVATEEYERRVSEFFARTLCPTSNCLRR